MKFTKPSKIQERALPLLLQDPCVYLYSACYPLTARLQATEFHWTIAVRYRKDRCLRTHYAFARGLFAPETAGIVSGTLSRTRSSDYDCCDRHGQVYAGADGVRDQGVPTEGRDECYGTGYCWYTRDDERSRSPEGHRHKARESVCTRRSRPDVGSGWAW